MIASSLMSSTAARGRASSSTTMVELGDHEANHRRLYELNRLCSADIPERGEFYTYDEYHAARIERDYEPSTTVIALDDGAWVGMSAASDHHDEGFFFNEMTGVRRSVTEAAVSRWP